MEQEGRSRAVSPGWCFGSRGVVFFFLRGDEQGGIAPLRGVRIHREVQLLALPSTAAFTIAICAVQVI